AEFGLSNSYTTDQVRYSAEQLDGFASQIQSIVDRWPSAEGLLGFGVRTELNKVEVLLTSSQPDLVNTITAAVPADALQVTIVPGATVSALYSRQTYPPYKAGKYVRDITAPHTVTCTAGFVFIVNSSGLKQGTTSGHCTRNSDWVYANYPAYDKPVGVANSNTFLPSDPTFGDATLIGFSTQSDATRYVIESTSVQRLVVSKFTNAGLTVGTALCKSGISSGATCGSVTRAYPQTRVVTYEDLTTGVQRARTVEHLICTNIYSIGGDSGAPVYQQLGSSDAKGAGLVSNATFSNGAFVEMCFDPVGNIEVDTATHLWIS